jgi:hypothetical protein
VLERGSLRFCCNSGQQIIALTKLHFIKLFQQFSSGHFYVKFLCPNTAALLRMFVKFCVFQKAGMLKKMNMDQIRLIHSQNSGVP